MDHDSFALAPARLSIHIPASVASTEAGMYIVFKQ
jgi:hypothetical protein